MVLISVPASEYFFLQIQIDPMTSARPLHTVTSVVVTQFFYFKERSTAMSKKESLKIKKIGLVIKHHQPEAAAFGKQMAELILSKGCQIYFADETQNVAEELIESLKTAPGQIQIIPKPSLVDHCDLIVVLGGDGTFLSIARLMKNRSVPVLGVNMGQLGFLTEIKRDEAVSTLEGLIAGTPPLLSERSLLEVTLQRDNEIIFQGPVVNDAVISKGAIARIIGMQVWVNQQWVHHVRADGIIVSTPTGSTAYALAAAGPIVEPSVSALVVAPICPHSLTLRPLVIPDTYEVKICLSDRPGHVLLTLDGQDVVDMKEGDFVLVRKFKKHSLKLVTAPTRDYFSLLREKLKFGVRD
jgi:NAD+ kinase